MKTTIKKNLTEYYLWILGGKKIVAVLLAVLFCASAYAQEDTTKIKMGKKKIIIVEEKDKIEKGITDLNKGKADLDAKKAELQARLASVQDSMNILIQKRQTESNQEQINALNKQMNNLENQKSDLEKQIAACDNGIDQIDDEISDLNDDLADMRDELRDDDDDDNDHHAKSKKSKHHKFDSHWSGLEFGYNSFLNSNHKMELPTAADGIDGSFMELNTNKSFALSWNIFEIDLPVTRNIGFATGMGLEWNNYRFKKNIDLYEDADGIIRGQLIDRTERDYTKNTLNTTYLTVPLLFEIQKGDFFVNFGVIGGLKINSKTKKFYDADGDKIRKKLKGDYQLSPFRYEATARIGYDFVQLFANYSLVPLFEKNKGPELYPFTVGLRLGF